MSEVLLRGVCAGYRGCPVLTGVELAVPAGTTTAVLGGSGSGKTTLLRVIAGFLRPDAGSVVVGGRQVAGDGVWVAPDKRGIGYVRQDGALFPHLSVADNISFGLAWPRRRHRGRVMELLELVGLSTELAGRRPDQLSGGQQQRVALARALAPGPELVLLDEPFSSLDTALRASTREAVARALRAAHATAILVTHDQGEALSFADEVAILDHGRFTQVAAPREIYLEPADEAVAAFLGEALLLPGTADGALVSCALGDLPVAQAHRGGPRGAVRVMVRPEQLKLAPLQPGWPGAQVRGVSFFGHDAVVELDLPGSAGIRARVLGHECPRVGDTVRIEVSGPVRAFPGDATAPPMSAVNRATAPTSAD
ncbi:MAG: ABC transporter ATP-binding protein [Actinomycetales bacterium]